MTDRDAGRAGAEEAARRAVAAIDRDTRARVLATVARWFGDLDLAEDVTQEAVVQALRTWPRTGVPDAPEAWLKTAAKRKALDAVRRERVLAEKLARLRIEEERAPARAGLADPAEGGEAPGHPALADDRLGMLVACAHPALRVEDRIALTLRFVAGLDTASVAHALLVPVPTLQQRLVRAKRRIRALDAPFAAPREGEVAERLAAVQRVVYLLYAEGFARSAGDAHTREDLTGEAIRLARLLRRLAPRSPESAGLLALLLLTEARRPARIGAEGAPVPLAAQDRARWDRALVAEGLALAEAAARESGVAVRTGRAAGGGPYAIQAAIAAVHAEAESFAETDWAQIAVLYGLLEAREPGPVVRLGRAVALGRLRGAGTGIRLLDALAHDPVLARFRPYHVARAVTLQELGDAAGAAAAYRRALELPGNAAEDGFLAASLAGLDEVGAA